MTPSTLFVYRWARSKHITRRWALLLAVLWRLQPESYRSLPWPAEPTK